MFLGHFSVAVASKPLVPKINLWILIAAAQLVDIFCIALAASGLEGFHKDSRPLEYGGVIGDIMYSHALLSAVLLSILTYYLASRYWRDIKIAVVLTALVFSHWILDLIVHHPDMPFLPGNIGNYSLLGLDLWSLPVISLIMEAAMAGIAIILYYVFYSRLQGTRKSRIAFIAVALFFIVTTGFHMHQLP